MEVKPIKRICPSVMRARRINVSRHARGATKGHQAFEHQHEAEGEQQGGGHRCLPSLSPPRPTLFICAEEFGSGSTTSTSGLALEAVAIGFQATVKA